MKRWYVINAYSGFEEQVKDSLEQCIKLSGMEEKFGRILIPTEDVMELKKGKKKLTTRKFYPGYLIIEMEMNEDTWNLVKITPKVSGFIGNKTTPVPLETKEVETILAQVNGVRSEPKLSVSFETGETVKIMDGPFSGFTGTIDNMNFEKTRLKVMVTIFGRQTPVELDFVQVEKI